MIIFLAKARKLSILPTFLDIFDLQQHYIRILYIFDQREFNFGKIENAVYQHFLPLSPLSENTQNLPSSGSSAVLNVWKTVKMYLNLYCAIMKDYSMVILNGNCW